MQLETYLRKCSNLGITEHEVRHKNRSRGEVAIYIQPLRMPAFGLNLIVQGEQVDQDPATRTPQFPDIA